MDSLNCRAMIAVEMIGLMGNGIWDFPNCPTPSDVCNFVILSLQYQPTVKSCRCLVY